jgi:hypothetical protein
VLGIDLGILAILISKQEATMVFSGVFCGAFIVDLFFIFEALK